MPKLKDPRICKIFFSSPFRGMEEEREELTRKYFPQLRHLCNLHGLQFVAIDMRWGITAESSDKAQVINICLREIDRSDMFIGFFGQRYGWFGASDEILQHNFDNAVSMYPWLDNVRDKSVTELEFLHGHLNQPGNLPAAIFFRDKAYDDSMREAGSRKGDTREVLKYSAENEESVQLMDDLKQRVKATQEQTLGVHMAYKTPADAAKMMFDIIWKYLTETLLGDLRAKAPSKRETILSQHDAFLASRENVYVPIHEYFSELDKHLILAEPTQRVVVTGIPGSGKSALLCNWITRVRKEHRNLVIVYHFVGHAEGSTEVRAMMERLVAEFQFWLKELQGGGDVVKETKEKNYNILTDVDHVLVAMQDLVVALNRLISVGKVPVIVIDGLDKIKSDSKIGKALYWLPVNLPSSCAVLLSTLSSDTVSLHELQNQNYVTMEIQPLNETRRRDICLKSLQDRGKELSPGQLERIVAADNCSNPLFLRLTLSELVAFGYFRLLDKKIDSLIYSENIGELFQQFLQRLEEDYNVADYQGNLVEQVMCSIRLSHNGLSESELKAIFFIDDHIWSPLYFAMERVIVDQSGFITLGFTELREAIEKRYLTEDKKRHYLRVLVHYFNRELEKVNNPFKVDVEPRRPVSELPWLWLELGDREGLAKCLSHRVVFSELEQTRLYELMGLWGKTGYDSSQIVAALLNTYDLSVVDLYNKMQKEYYTDHPTPGLCLESFLQRIDTFLEAAVFDQTREQVLKKHIQVLREGLAGKVVNNKRAVVEDLQFSMYRLACLYCQFYQVERGVNLHLELLEMKESILNDPEREVTEELMASLGYSYHGLGVGYMNLKEYDKALEYFRKSIEWWGKTKSGLKQLGQAYNNMGLSYMGKGEHETAVQYIEKAITAIEEVNFGQQPPLVGELISNQGLCYRKLGQLDKAEELYQKSLEVKIRALGKVHQVVAMGYMNLGTLEAYRNNYEKAVVHSEEAIEIYKALSWTWDNPQFIMALENRCSFLCGLYKYKEASENFMRLLEWRVKDGSMDNCIGGAYQEVAKFYIREHDLDKAFKVTSALLQSRHRQETESYIHMDLILKEMGPEKVKELQVPEEYMVPNAIENNPGDSNLIRYWASNHLIPNNQAEELVRLINRLHDLSEFGEAAYTQTADWCTVNEEEIAEDCFFRITEEGVKRYPDNPLLQLNLAKSYVRQDNRQMAAPILTTLAEREPGNFGLVMFAAQTALLAVQVDDARKLCEILRNFTGEEEQEKAKLYQNFLAEVEEYQKSQEEAENQPSQSENQPSQSENQPSKSENQPWQSENQPSQPENQPSQSENQPSQSENQPSQSEN